MSDQRALALGSMLFACGVFVGSAFMALMVAGDVSAAALGAALACIPAWGARGLWKDRADD